VALPAGHWSLIKAAIFFFAMRYSFVVLAF
jgi:hypothetical protein